MKNRMIEEEDEKKDGEITIEERLVTTEERLTTRG